MQDSGYEHRLWSHTIWVDVLSLPLSVSVTLDKLLSPSRFSSLHRVLWGLNTCEAFITWLSVWTVLMSMLLGAEMKDVQSPVAFSLKSHTYSLGEGLLASVPMAPCTTLSIVYITCMVSIYLSYAPPLKCKLHEDKNSVFSSLSLQCLAYGLYSINNY